MISRATEFARRRQKRNLPVYPLDDLGEKALREQSVYDGWALVSWAICRDDMEWIAYWMKTNPHKWKA